MMMVGLSVGAIMDDITITATARYTSSCVESIEHRCFLLHRLKAVNISDLSSYSLFPLVSGTNDNHMVTAIPTGPAEE